MDTDGTENRGTNMKDKIKRINQLQQSTKRQKDKKTEAHIRCQNLRNKLIITNTETTERNENRGSY